MTTFSLLFASPMAVDKAVGMPGMWELLVILTIVLLVFGPGKMGQIGEAMGKSIRGFKRAVEEPAPKALDGEVDTPARSSSN